MNEDSRKNPPSGLEHQCNELDEEQLDKVSGGEKSTLGLSGIFPGHQICSVNPKHRVPYGCKVCPVCGSTEFI